MSEKLTPGQVVYLTKYALTTGIVAKIVKTVHEYSGHTSVWVEGDAWTSYRFGREAFTNGSEAIADAEARRVKKIAALKKQVGKLEKLTFTSPEPHHDA